MRTLCMLLVMGALLASSGAATAQDGTQKPKERAKELLGKLDTDKDGCVSRAEFGGDDWIFDHLDKNHDGKLDAKELAANGDKAGRSAAAGPAGERVKALFAAADKNGDGKLSLQEFTGHAFARLDVNKDGVISEEDRPAGGQRPALRQRMRERASERGAKYDKDGDGALSKEEFAAMQADIFKGLDKNADGFLTSDELPAAAAPGQGGGAGPMLKRMDTDGDGRISKEEWRGREQLFVRLDRNGDGYIDAQEIPRDLVRPAGPQGGPGERLQMLKRMDTDHDGRISREEWRGAPERFDRLDRNGDGYIDRDDRDMR